MCGPTRSFTAHVWAIPQALCHVQADTVLQTFNTSNTSSANGAVICLRACRQYRPALPQYQPRCNTWNWCNATSCTYSVNTTSNLTLSSQTCVLGYSRDAATNQPVGAINTGMSGFWSGMVRCLCCGIAVEKPLVLHLPGRLVACTCASVSSPCTVVCHVCSPGSVCYASSM